MTDQHYGRAPCRCSRVEVTLYAWDGSYRIGDVAELCVSHGVYGRPWHAASAIEHGLRAIAGWPMPLVEVCGGVMRLDDAAKLRTLLGREQPVKEAKWEDVAPPISELSASYTRKIGVPPDVAREVLAVVGLTGAALRRRGYQPVGTLAGAPVWTDPYLRGDQRVQLADGGYIISREAWAEASKKAVYPVSARTVGHPDKFADCDCPSHLGDDGEVMVRPSKRIKCYFCGGQLSTEDGECPKCEWRQP